MSTEPDTEVLYEFIKEFLTENNFESTFECFKAEIRAKKVSKEFKMKAQNEISMGITESEWRFHKLMRDSEKVKEWENENKKLIEAWQKALIIAADLIKKIENLRLNADQEIIANYRLQISRLCSQFGLKIDEVQQSFERTSIKVQDYKERILENLNSKDYNSLNKNLIELRNESLLIPKEGRQDYLNSLVARNIFSNNLKKFLEVDNRNTKKNILGIVSILCSSQQGRQYILANNAEWLINFFINFAKIAPSGSVSQRFSISILQKLTYSEDEVCMMISRTDFIEWLIKNLLYTQIMRKSRSHPFIQIFGSALLANLLNYQSGRDFVLNFSDINALLRCLLTILKDPELQIGSIYPILLSISVISATKNIEDINISNEIQEFIEIFRRRQAVDEDFRSIIFSACTNITQKQEIIHKSSEDNSSEQILDFECFPDEIL
ncbi:unnamed protein product [Blepharisma stoltei]|uniref:LisH domain-containing protein ARMC9 n=1 Tax=Blepharisma stoltei TaxID=1481888 RepID=A0AAU9K7Z5_9CILI|nr:unnamed protein product [Blepharisma stoltei]